MAVPGYVSYNGAKYVDVHMEKHLREATVVAAPKIARSTETQYWTAATSSACSVGVLMERIPDSSGTPS